METQLHWLLFERFDLHGGSLYHICDQVFLPRLCMYPPLPLEVQKMSLNKAGHMIS